MDDVAEVRARLAALEKQVLSILRFLNEALQESVQVHDKLDGPRGGP